MIDDRAVVRRLMLYKLRAKVEISKQDQVLVAVSWGIRFSGFAN
jgi:folate-binding Fe-S cluster repair protein YgfZ